MPRDRLLSWLGALESLLLNDDDQDSLVTTHNASRGITSTQTALGQQQHLLQQILLVRARGSSQITHVRLSAILSAYLIVFIVFAGVLG